MELYFVFGTISTYGDVEWTHSMASFTPTAAPPPPDDHPLTNHQILERVRFDHGATTQFNPLVHLSSENDWLWFTVEGVNS